MAVSLLGMKWREWGRGIGFGKRVVLVDEAAKFSFLRSPLLSVLVPDRSVVEAGREQVGAIGCGKEMGDGEW